ncbi:putative transcription factor C2H2 family [Lupinus albus]|uniref:Putative transcription factor C2H2 family n=1 Tax=Lupinus albus TaxID=3870 RepID=A0A6A4PPN3_LUPAL|nr:putative transcription factor C2H2 family [Lupinus albus]
MAHHHHSQRHYQPQSQPSDSFRNINSIHFDDQMPQPPSYPNPNDFPHHPFHVVGLAPPEGSYGGADLQWNYCLEPERKRLKEHDFMESNSKISCVEFMKPRSVSTGLGLSLDNTRMSSVGDSLLLSLFGNDIDRELLQQDVEIDRFLRAQGKRLRETIIEKVQATQLESISIIEDRVVQKLREKEAEIEGINKRNIELEERLEQLAVEADAWQQRASYSENMVAALKFNLEQVYAQSRDSKEGCGDSEVDDTASCINGGTIDFHLLSKGNNNMKEMMTCKVCKVNEVNMLLLPCKHLCLCKDCESKLSFCPLCQSSKFIGIEVYV